MQEDKDACRCKSKTWAEAILDFVDDRENSGSSEKKQFVNNWSKRFYASFFGSVLFHLTLLVMAARALTWLSTDVFLLCVLFIVVVSAFIALIVSTGNKGGLIRRFWYGVTLPAVCYYLASKIIWPLVSTLETASSVTS